MNVVMSYNVFLANQTRRKLSGEQKTDLCFYGQFLCLHESQLQIYKCFYGWMARVPTHPFKLNSLMRGNFYDTKVQ